MFKTYYRLAKPGIIRGNALVATAGFILASGRDIDWGLLAAMLAGLSLIVASACVFNNYLDRDIDKKMNRTKNRALVSGSVSPRRALIYGSALELAGTVILSLYTNFLTVSVALVGFFFYVVVYGYFKRRSVHGTIIGSISGATPPVVGYVVVTNHLDAAALILFLILVCWQMPHFYAIAIYRLKDYKAAGIPVLPAVRGIRAAKIQILFYIAAFAVAVSLLTVYDYTGWVYMVLMLAAGLAWLALGIKGFSTADSARWARKMFGFSLIVIVVFSFVLSVDALLP